MKKLLKKRKLIKHHRGWLKVFSNILERTDSPYVRGYVSKMIERHERYISKLKRL